jgi:hypothetical protein
MPTPTSMQPTLPLLTPQGNASDPFTEAINKLRMPDPNAAQDQQPNQMAQMAQDIWRLNMMQLPENTGGAQLDIYGSGQIDPKTGKPGQVDPAMATARLQQVYQNRPDLIWPGMNRDGTIDMAFTGDRYDR